MRYVVSLVVLSVGRCVAYWPATILKEHNRGKAVVAVRVCLIDLYAIMGNRRHSPLGSHSSMFVCLCGL